MSYQLFHEEDGVLIRLWGNITFNEIIEVNTLSWTRPDWDSIQFQIWDMREIEFLGINEARSKALAAGDEAAVSVRGSLKVAVVAEDPQMIKDIDNYIGALEGGPVQARIFKTEKAARRWVDERDPLTVPRPRDPGDP